LAEKPHPAHHKAHRPSALSNFLSSSLGATKGAALPYGAHVVPHDGTADPTDPASLRHHSHKAAGGGGGHNSAVITALPLLLHRNATASAARSSPCPAPQPPAVKGGPELEVPCGCEFDPGAPGAYNPTTSSSHGSKAATTAPRVLVFNAGGMALGNALLGYLTTYHDALRSGRVLVLARSGLVSGALAVAFDLGLPWVHPTDVAEKPQAQIFFDYAQTPCPACVSYLQSGFRSPRVAGTRVAHSRPRNFHFDRPDRFSECYYRALGHCPQPPKGINTAKQEENPVAYCGESAALRRLIQRPSGELRRLGPLFEAHWNGSPGRLAALMSHDTAQRDAPIWAVAVHARVQFKFVEQGIDERAPAAVAAVQAWLGSSATKAKLAALVKEVTSALVKQRLPSGRRRRRRLQGRRRLSSPSNATAAVENAATRQPLDAFALAAARAAAAAELEPPPGQHLPPLPQAVYVASETALVRRHVADLLRARGVAADYAALSGTAHPVDKEAGNGRFVQYHAAGASAVVGRSANNGTTANDVGAGAGRFSTADDERKADALFPYLEWWALAHSKAIFVRRGEGLSKAPSTYSGTAHLYGSWSAAHPRGRVPQLDAFDRADDGLLGGGAAADKKAR
jgi:hypothetical protein